MYEWDDKYLCICLPKSETDIFRILAQQKYPRAQESEDEVVFRFHRSAVAAIMTVILPRLTPLAAAANVLPYPTGRIWSTTAESTADFIQLT
jgi:hypothetical protein